MNLVHVVQDENLSSVMVKLPNSTTYEEIEVAVGVVTNEAGALLVAKRPLHWRGGGFWEFPGGKIEPGEDSLTALKREMLEEVGLIIHECVHLIQLTHSYPERHVLLDAWQVQSYSGVASGLEGQEIAWVFPSELKNLNMLPANHEIVLLLTGLSSL